LSRDLHMSFWGLWGLRGKACSVFLSLSSISRQLKIPRLTTMETI
jgi:hypothetical protein